jgi:hypothetical protein
VNEFDELLDVVDLKLLIFCSYLSTTSTTLRLNLLLGCGVRTQHQLVTSISDQITVKSKCLYILALPKPRNSVKCADDRELLPKLGRVG